MLQSQLAEVGINLNIVTQDDNTSFSLIEAGEDFDLMLDFWQTNTGHADYVFNGMLLSTSVNNFSRYYNPEFDETYVKYASTGEGEEREALLKQLYDDMVTDPNYRPLQRDKGDCSHIKAPGTDAEPDWRA